MSMLYDKVELTQIKRQKDSLGNVLPLPKEFEKFENYNNLYIVSKYMDNGEGQEIKRNFVCNLPDKIDEKNQIFQHAMMNYSNDNNMNKLVTDFSNFCENNNDYVVKEEIKDEEAKTRVFGKINNNITRTYNIFASYDEKIRKFSSTKPSKEVIDYMKNKINLSADQERLLNDVRLNPFAQLGLTREFTPEKAKSNDIVKISNKWAEILNPFVKAVQKDFVTKKNNSKEISDYSFKCLNLQNDVMNYGQILTNTNLLALNDLYQTSQQFDDISLYEIKDLEKKMVTSTDEEKNVLNRAIEVKKQKYIDDKEMNLANRLNMYYSNVSLEDSVANQPNLSIPQQVRKTCLQKKQILDYFREVKNNPEYESTNPELYNDLKKLPNECLDHSNARFNEIIRSFFDNTETLKEREDTAFLSKTLAKFVVAKAFNDRLENMIKEVDNDTVAFENKNNDKETHFTNKIKPFERKILEDELNISRRRFKAYREIFTEFNSNKYVFDNFNYKDFLNEVSIEVNYRFKGADWSRMEERQKFKDDLLTKTPDEQRVALKSIYQKEHSRVVVDSLSDDEVLDRVNQLKGFRGIGNGSKHSFVKDIMNGSNPDYTWDEFKKKYDGKNIAYGFMTDNELRNFNNYVYHRALNIGEDAKTLNNSVIQTENSSNGITPTQQNYIDAFNEAKESNLTSDEDLAKSLLSLNLNKMLNDKEINMVDFSNLFKISAMDSYLASGKTNGNLTMKAVMNTFKTMIVQIAMDSYPKVNQQNVNPQNAKNETILD